MNAQAQRAAPDGTATFAELPGSVVVENSRPYPWPYDHRLPTTNFAFLVVTGSTAGASGQPTSELMAECRKVADEFVAFGSPVIWVACNGSAAPDVAAADELIVESPTGNGFIGSNLELVLRTNEIDRFALAGWPFEIAVHSTMRRANDMGYECLMLEDLCSPLDDELQTSSISQILMSGGIFGAVGQSSDLIAAMKEAQSTRPAEESGQGAASL